MNIFNYFSIEQRKKRAIHFQKKQIERKLKKANSIFKDLIQSDDLNIAIYILKGLELERLCCWPPDLTFFKFYLAALLFQSVGYLWLAENVHVRLNNPYGSQYGLTHGILTWKRSAQKARQLLERSKSAIKKIDFNKPNIFEEIDSTLSKMIERAVIAQGTGLEEVWGVESYLPEKGELKFSGGTFPPEIIGGIWAGFEKPGDLTIKDTRIKAILNTLNLNKWLYEDIINMGDIVELKEELTVFNGIHVMYADDPSDGYQLKIIKEIEHNTIQLTVKDSNVTLALTDYYGLLIFAETMQGKNLISATFGNLYIVGSLPLT